MGARAVTDGSAFQMRSPIGWALLGLLIERTGYGYDLVQRFERAYGDALELSSPSQIYKALDALERRSLIERLAPDGTNPDAERQPKPHYRATAQGQRSYQEHLIALACEKRQRSALFARQLAAIDPRAALAVLDRYEQACLQGPASAAEDPSLGGVAGRLIAEDERLAVEASLSWIAYVRRELQASIGAQTGARGAGQ
jgi:DNA-binding PadR family transcriptional regulator